MTSEPNAEIWVASGACPSAVKPGSMTTAMIANPTHGSALTFFDALYATNSGRKTKTLFHIRLTNCHDGSSTTPGAFHAGMTPSVAMRAMNVMNSDAPSSAPRIGRNESERNSNRLSSQAKRPRGPLARSRALIAAMSSSDAAPPLVIDGSPMMSV